MTAGAVVVGEEKPSYAPAHKLPAWISSADLHDEIRRLADEGRDKAACWDFTQAVYRLTAQAQGLALANHTKGERKGE